MNVHVTLRHLGVEYDFYDHFDDEIFCADAEPERAARYMYTEGNYGCDCNRSLFIQDRCDASFPDMECGEEIALVALEAEGRSILWEDGAAARLRAMGLFAVGGTA